MKRIILIFSFIIAFIITILSTPFVSAGGDNSYIIREYNTNRPETVKIVYAEINDKRATARIVGLSRTFKSGISPAAVISKNIGDVVIGSGFVDTFSPLVPVGYLVVDGTIINRINRKGFEPIVVVKNGELEIIKSHYKFRDIRIPDGAIQTGPLLVDDGKNVARKFPTYSGVKYTRSFICKKADGNTIVGITLTRIGLTELANILISNKFKCACAVNLAGGGSEALVYKKGNKVFAHGNMLSRQASLVSFKAKK